MQPRAFDDLLRAITASASRRRTLRLLLGAPLGLILVDGPPGGAPAMAGETCLLSGAICRHSTQCCSRRCQKKRHKKKGTCASLGPLAANCTPPATPCDNNALPRCSLDGVAMMGTCYSTLSGEVICASSINCNTNAASPPICQSDQDCVDQTSGVRCVRCTSDICIGDRGCAVYLGG